MQHFDLHPTDYDEAYSNGHDIVPSAATTTAAAATTTTATVTPGHIVTDTNAVDVAFRKINKHSTNFLIWKIENIAVVAVPKDAYGTFLTGASYVILAENIQGHATGTDTVCRDARNQPMEYHIHFWRGSKATAESCGVAAYKSVELDGLLGGCTTQHREVQGNESTRFLSYFKKGIRILKNSNDETLPKLYRLKGKRTPVMTELDSIAWDQFNSSDILILHTENVLYVWVGRASNPTERHHASKISNDMQEKHNIPKVLFLDDGYEKSATECDCREFTKLLPLNKRHVMPSGPSADDNADTCHLNGGAPKGNHLHHQHHHHHPVYHHKLRLYKCAEYGGKYRVVELKTGPLNQYDLSSNDVFIVDQEITGVWVWVGKHVGCKERIEALRNARGFVKKKQYPNATRVTRVCDGFEPIEFKVLFSDWHTEMPVKSTKAKATLVSKIDATSLEERPSLAAELQLIDDGSGLVTIWRVKQNRIVELAKERHCYFFSADCYIVLYSYQIGSEQKHLLYYWLGSQANQEEVGTASSKISEMEMDLPTIGFQARVIQGKEPAHFLQLFKGRLTIFKGKGTDLDESGRNAKSPSAYLLHVFGSSPSTAKAVHIQSKASLLNSNYCFVLKRGGKMSYIWCGSHSTGDQREIAKGFAGKHFELVLEGREKDEFFDGLGGRAIYAQQLKGPDPDIRPPRLIHCVLQTGAAVTKYKMEEALFFKQADMFPEDVIIVDVYHTLYIWMGSLSTREEQRSSLQNALDYLQSDPSGRDMNIPIIQLRQGLEPPTFTGLFPSWDRNFWKDYKPFGKIRRDLETKASHTNGSTHHSDSDGNTMCSEFDLYDKYPVEILKEPNEKLPSRVDPLNKELHLTNDDFISIFKMQYADFEKLPKWKQQELKKRTGLF